MNTFTASFTFFFKTTAELIILFLAITTLVELIMMHLPPYRIRRLLSGKGKSLIAGNILGASLGALTPFCACSTIPLLSGMLKAKAPFGSVMSFLIASPLLNPMIIGMLAAFLGWKLALTYLGIGVINAVLFGWIMERANGARFIKPARTPIGCCKEKLPEFHSPKTWREKIKKASWTALNGSLKPVFPYLLIGVAIGSVIYGYLPEDLVLKLAGPQSPLAVPVAAVIGVPLYIRVEPAIAIGVAMMEKGMSVGAVIALIIGGAGMAIPEMSLLAGIFRKRLVGAIILFIFLTAVSGGIIFNLLVS